MYFTVFYYRGVKLYRDIVKKFKVYLNILENFAEKFITKEGYGEL